MMAQEEAPHIVWNGSEFTWTDRMYIGQTNNNSAGKAGSTSYYRAVLDFIPCQILANKTVSITGSGITSSVLISCAFYSENNEESYITNSAIAKDDTKKVPNNARFCRFAMRMGYSTNDFYLTTI